MRKINRLIKEGGESATFRGHVMKQTHRRTDSNNTIAIYECRNCQRTFKCQTNPAPNDCELTGSALALGCNDEE